MPLGPGKYDKEVRQLLADTSAKVVLIAVLAGNKGSGFSVAGQVGITIDLPRILRDVASQIEREELRQKLQ